MTILDYTALFLLLGIALLAITVLWQIYVVLSEIYSLDRYQGSTRLPWIAAAVFFSFSLAIYYFCPNARKKGRVFFVLGAAGVLSYGAGMYLKHIALSS